MKDGGSIIFSVLSESGSKFGNANDMSLSIKTQEKVEGGMNINQSISIANE